MTMNFDEVNGFLDLPTHLPNEEMEKPMEESSIPANTPKESPKEVIYIEGTNISLQTEEDIANWIAERRKRWPTRKNIELKNSQITHKRPAQEASHQPAKIRKTVCRFYQQQGRCRFGNKCKNSHEEQKSDSLHHVINGIEVRIPKIYSKRGDSSIFRSLVKQDQYEHENTLITSFIEFLEQKGRIDHDVMRTNT